MKNNSQLPPTRAHIHDLGGVLCCCAKYSYFWWTTGYKATLPIGLDTPLPMSALDLPTELIAHIIIEAHNIGGVSALSSCALVCSTWNLISRPNILYKIKLTTIIHLRDLGSLLDADPSVPPFVRVLVVQPLVEEPLVASPWIEQVPQILPSRLPNLHTIHLNDLCDFGEHINPQFITHFSTFSTVRNLAFDNAVIDFDRLISIAASLPALQVVDFGFMRPLGSSTPTCPRIRSPRLLSLGVHAGRIESKALEHVVGWLAPSYHSLRQLELSIYIGNTRTVGRLLRDIGKGLERLELRLEAMFPASVEAEGKQPVH